VRIGPSHLHEQLENCDGHQAARWGLENGDGLRPYRQQWRRSATLPGGHLQPAPRNIVILLEGSDLFQGWVERRDTACLVQDFGIGAFVWLLSQAGIGSDRGEHSEN